MEKLFAGPCEKIIDMVRQYKPLNTRVSLRHVYALQAHQIPFTNLK